MFFIVKPYDKPEHILNIILQGFLLKLYLTKGSVKSCPLARNLITPGFSLTTSDYIAKNI